MPPTCTGVMERLDFILPPIDRQVYEQTLLCELALHGHSFKCTFTWVHRQHSIGRDVWLMESAGLCGSPEKEATAWCIYGPV